MIYPEMDTRVDLGSRCDLSNVGAAPQLMPKAVERVLARESHGQLNIEVHARAMERERRRPDLLVTAGYGDY